jgi:hypothetical protein
MHAMVGVAVRPAAHEAVVDHLAVADVHQPILVVPARAACAAGEPEVGPVAASLLRVPKTSSVLVMAVSITEMRKRAQ